MLDAGHNASGGDTGAQGNGLKEQDVTYQIAQKVGDRLKKQGILVKYSRDTVTSNVGKTLSESINGRVKMANDWKADLFISIHCNAFSDTTVSGTETLVYSLKSGAALLAQMVNSNLTRLGFKNRGVKARPDLGVLKNTDMTAILVEVGFITNLSDAQILRDRQDEIAQAIVEAVFEYTGLEVIPLTAEQAIDKIIAKGVDTDKKFWLTACEHVKFLDALFIKIADKM